MRQLLPTLTLGILLSINAFAGSIEVKVNGLVCNLCAQGIEKKFEAQEAVKEINVDMDEMVVKLEFKDGKSLSEATITNLIEDAGYNVEGFSK